MTVCNRGYDELGQGGLLNDMTSELRSEYIVFSRTQPKKILSLKTCGIST